MFVHEENVHTNIYQVFIIYMYIKLYLFFYVDYFMHIFFISEYLVHLYSAIFKKIKSDTFVCFECTCSNIRIYIRMYLYSSLYFYVIDRTNMR